MQINFFLKKKKLHYLSIYIYIYYNLNNEIIILHIHKVIKIDNLFTTTSPTL